MDVQREVHVTVGSELTYEHASKCIGEGRKKGGIDLQRSWAAKRILVEGARVGHNHGCRIESIERDQLITWIIEVGVHAVGQVTWNGVGGYKFTGEPGKVCTAEQRTEYERCSQE